MSFMDGPLFCATKLQNLDHPDENSILQFSHLPTCLWPRTHQGCRNSQTVYCFCFQFLKITLPEFASTSSFFYKAISQKINRFHSFRFLGLHKANEMKLSNRAKIWLKATIGN